MARRSERAEVADFPDRLDARCRRHHFGLRAAPIGFDRVAAFAIDALLGELGRRQRRFFGEFLIGVQLAFDARVDFGFRSSRPRACFR